MLDEACQAGRALTVCLWSDETVLRLDGQPPKFPLDERLYILNAIRYVSYVEICPDEVVEVDTLPGVSGIQPDVWVVDEASDNPAKRAFCAVPGIEYVVIPEASLRVFPAWQSGREVSRQPLGKRSSSPAVSTGCIPGMSVFLRKFPGWAICMLALGTMPTCACSKARGIHSFPEAERRYMVQSIRYVKEALITSGHGWMDAEPEIKHVGIDAYAVNDESAINPKNAPFAPNTGWNILC